MKFSYSLLKRLLPDTPAKTELAELLNARVFQVERINGDVVEVSLPANRYSDAASHIGLAREIAAARGRTFRSPVKTLVNLPVRQGFAEAEVREKVSCPRYAARYFELKKVGIAPAWMKKALQSCGIRSVNAVVDIMNYVMVETGQPLHAFDAEKLTTSDKRHETKKIIIRNAKKGEKIETLDGQKIALDPSVLVIADNKRPLAIAGIKGGKDSGVTGRTRRIIVEGANFDGVRILKTARMLKLQTDAAARFAHAISPALVDQGLDRATELLTKIGARLVDSVDRAAKMPADEVMGMNVREYESFIGASVSAEKAKKHLRALGFEVEAKGEALRVRIPAWRNDIDTKEALMEEVARLEGYDKLKPQAPVVALRPVEEDDMVRIKDMVRSVLVSFGFDELYNYSFVGERELKRLAEIRGISPRAVELENPISEEFRYLRPALLPSLLKNAQENLRWFDVVRFFEIGNVFEGTARGVREELHCGVGIATKRTPALLDVKGVLYEVLRALGLPDHFIKEDRGVLRVEVDHHAVGELRLVALEKEQWAAVLELSLAHLLPLVQGEREYLPLPKYPFVVRDLSLLLPQEVRIGKASETIEAASDLIADVDLADEYRDEKLGDRYSVTFRIVFQSNERTLTDAEVEREMKRIIAAVRKGLRAEVR